MQRDYQISAVHRFAQARANGNAEARQSGSHVLQQNQKAGMGMNAVVEMPRSNSLVRRMADKYGVDADKMMETLKATAFKGPVSNEQMMALLIVSEQHGLNPWTKEIYAFPDSRNGIVPVVGVDGWARIINEHPQCDGIDFNEAEDGAWIECVIHRKDREHPTKIKEWFSECKRDTAPWKSHPRRMLRHKALIQCARIAFGFGGIYDQDEAERIIEAEPIMVSASVINPRGDQSGVTDELCEPYIQAITDILNADKEEHEIAAMLREHDIEMSRFPEIAIGVSDRLAKRGICKKQAYKDWLKVGINRGDTHTS
jgi:phage recombination protein Bet